MGDFRVVVRLLSRRFAAPLAVLGLLVPVPASPQEKKMNDPVGVESAGEALAVAGGEVPRKSNSATGAAISSTFSGSANSAPYRVATVRANATVYVAVSVEFKTQAARAAYRDPEATVFAANERFADVFVATDAAYDRLVDNPQVVRFEVVGQASVPPPPLLRLAPSTKLVPEAVVRGGLDGYTGKGVIIAVVDTGLDFRHPDFVRTDLTGKPASRLLYFWDTLSAPRGTIAPTESPLKYPNGVSVGALYSREQLTEDLRSGLRQIPDPDSNSHGTAAAGIAAGNGRASNGRWVGVAPDADLIGVKIGEASGAMPNSYLLNAITEWLFRVAQAQGKALVISCSFGGQHGPRNGSTVFERHLSSHFGVVPGRVMFVAAGNERSLGLHAKVRFGGANQPGMLAWCADGNSAIEMYFSAGGGTVDARDLVFEPVKLNWSPGASNGCSAPGSKMIEKVDPMEINPISNEGETAMAVGTGPGGLRLSSHSGKSYTLDAYFAGAATNSGFYGSINAGANRVQVLYPGEQVGTPGTSQYVMTIGSYDWNDQFDGATQSSEGMPVIPGQLSSYSNPGYSRAGVIKPEIVAPGQYWTSSNARLSNGAPVEPHGSDKTGNYRIFNGTSAATPYAAGIAALMLQKNPRLTMLDIKNYLTRSATADARTGQVPNLNWGYGKLDLAAVHRALAAVPSAGTAGTPPKKLTLSKPQN